jgi:phosphate transport system protein
MKHTESELLDIRNSIEQMWVLVRGQLDKSRQALLNNDLDLARVVTSTEKRVNAFELKIDSDCENFIALYSPVAIDLRLVLSILKINKTLERIGDFADGIARFVLSCESVENHQALLEALKIDQMMQKVDQMLEKILNALQEENTAQAGIVFSSDVLIDKLYADSTGILAEYVRNNLHDAEYVIRLTAVLKKIERCGDHCTNIMEEVIFYLDAKVVKHQKK